MSERVFYDGLGPENCPRRLNEFIASTTITEKGLRRVYGEHLFLFGRETPDELCLITVYQIPAELKPTAHEARRRYEAIAALRRDFFGFAT